jgi:hypothetical protein
MEAMEKDKRRKKEFVKKSLIEQLESEISESNYQQR